MSNLFANMNYFANVVPDLMGTVTLDCFSDPLYNDSGSHDQWNLRNTGQIVGNKNGVAGVDINLCPALSLLNGITTEVTVAVIDNGIATDNPDLQNFTTNSYHVDTAYNNWPLPPNVLIAPNQLCNNPEKHHGTNVAGIIGAQPNNGIGLAGIAPNCKILPISINFYNDVYNDSLQPNRQYMCGNAINLAWHPDYGNADVINCSWAWAGYTGNRVNFLSASIDSALQRGRNGKGCVIVFSAGNQGNNATLRSMSYPGNEPNLSDIITVGAIECDGTRLPVSNYGFSTLDVVAPGNYITTTNIGNSYNQYNEDFGGTSAAAPHVAGVAALMLSVNPDLTQQQVGNYIAQTAKKLDSCYTYQTFIDKPNGTWNNQTGYGLVDACAAVSMACGIPCGSHVTHYNSSICRNNGTTANDIRFGKHILEVTDDADFTNAKWYIGGIARTFLKKTGGNSFILSDYLLAHLATLGHLDTNKIDVYLKLPNDTIYHWTVSIQKVTLLGDYYNNHDSLGVKVSSNGNFGSVFLTDTSMQLLRLPCDNLEIINSDDISADFDTIPSIVHNGNETKLKYKLKDNVCHQVIKLKSNCDNCIEEFEINVYNFKPQVETHRDCSGGTRITVKSLNNCTNLRTKWRRDTSDVLLNNENTLIVDSTGTYKFEYYHPDDSSTLIHSIEINVPIIYPPMLTLESANTSLIDYDNNRCFFSAKINLAQGVTATNYKFFGSYDSSSPSGWTDPFEIQVSDTSTFINIYEEIECGKEGKYKFSISLASDINNTICDLIIPFNCNCDSCAELGKNIQTGRYADVYNPNSNRYENTYFADTNASGNAIRKNPHLNVDVTKCKKSFRLPAGVDISNVIINEVNSSAPDTTYYELRTVDSRVELYVELNSPCKVNNTSDINAATFSIKVVINGDTCEYLQVFQCGCLYYYDYTQSDSCKHIDIQPVTMRGGPPYLFSYSDSSCVREPITFWLYDAFGARLAPVYDILPSSPAQGTFSVDMTGQVPGVYFIVAENPVNEIFGVRKFIKQ